MLSQSERKDIQHNPMKQLIRSSRMQDTNLKESDFLDICRIGVFLIATEVGNNPVALALRVLSFNPNPCQL